MSNLDRRQSRTPGVRLKCLALCCALFFWLGLALPATAEDFEIVSPQISTALNVVDHQGFRWEVLPNGFVTSSSQAFATAAELSIAGKSQPFVLQEISVDGVEMRFVSEITPQLKCTRHVRIDRRTGTCRILDSVHNSGATAVQVEFALQHRLKVSIDQLTTSAGIDRTQTTGTGLAPAEFGLVAWHKSYEDAIVPNVLVYLGNATNRRAPAVVQSHGTGLSCGYTLNIEPRGTVSVLHGLAQRKLDKMPPAAELGALFAPFRSRRWLRDLPDSLCNTIVNLPAESEDDITSMPLTPLFDLADARQLLRSQADTLVIDRQSQLQGVVSGAGITLETEWGAAHIALADIAALRGSRADRAPLVYLRTGAILSGKVTASDLSLRSEAGTTTKLDVSLLDVLMLRASAGDGEFPPHATGIVVFESGQRLVGRFAENTRWKFATPWGMVEADASSLLRVLAVRQPQPLLHVNFQNGSRLHVLLPQQKLIFHDVRLGEVAVESEDIVEWFSAMPLESSPGVRAEPTGKVSPHETVSDPSTANSKPAKPAEEKTETAPMLSQSDMVRQKLALSLLKSARDSLRVGQLDQARQQAEAAEKLQAIYDANDDRPEKVLAEVQRRVSGIKTAEPTTPGAAGAEQNATENSDAEHLHTDRTSAESNARFTLPIAPPRGPALYLGGGQILVGEFATARLKLRTSGGAVEIDTNQIHSFRLQPAPNPMTPEFVWQVGENDVLQGSLASGMLEFRALGRDWPLSASHVFLCQVHVKIPGSNDPSPAMAVGLHDERPSDLSPTGRTLLHPDTLQLPPEALDLLAIGEKSRLRGTAQLERVTMETRFGQAAFTLPALQVLVGPACSNTPHGIALQDGQCLLGVPQFESLAFAVRGGTTTAVTPDGLDRLVLHAPAEETPLAPSTFETLSGECIAILPNDSPEFQILTPWGPRRVAWRDVLRLTNHPTGGFLIELNDGTQCYCFVEATELVFHTPLFGRCTIHTAELRAVTQSGTTQSELTLPVWELSGGNRLAGEIAAPMLRFNTGQQEISVPVEQMRSLRTADVDSHSETRLWEALLWNGSTIRGRLLESALPLKLASGDAIRIPLRDFSGLQVATVPLQVRALIDELIRELGHEEFIRRETATRELIELLAVARPRLQSALVGQQDSEVEIRLKRILAHSQSNAINKNLKD